MTEPKTPGEAAFAAYFQEMDWKDRSVEYCTVLHSDIRGAWEKAAAAAIAHHAAEERQGAGRCACDHAPCRHDAHRFIAERDALAARVEELEGAARAAKDHVAIATTNSDRPDIVSRRLIQAYDSLAVALGEELAGGKP